MIISIFIYIKKSFTDALSICIFLHKRLFYVFMQFMDAPNIYNILVYE